MTAPPQRPVARRARLFSLFILAAAMLVSLWSPAISEACGGFFCSNPPSPNIPPVPIYQAGERVVFAFDNDSQRVTMHLEIAYSGESTNFAWLLPIPALPKGEGGNPLPLEDVLGLSTTMLFDQLQVTTDPKFDVDWSRSTEACGPRLFTSLNDDGTTTGGADEPLDRDGEDEVLVRVRDTASVGPYEAELIEATNTDALYAWLQERGYFEDPKAAALLSDYVALDFKFLALRLRKGVEPGEVRPISLKIDMTSACVPLRLTSIAAVEDMPMLVWVLGDNRAIPKNFLHAKVNPKALEWPGAPDYVKTVTKAINATSGRAFVTEYAAPDRIMEGVLYNTDIETFEQSIASARDFTTMLTWMMAYLPVADTDLRMSMSKHIAMPEGLRGYPFGNCAQVWTDTGQRGPQPACVADDVHATTEIEFYGYLDYWTDTLGANAIEVDLEGLRSEMELGYFAPRRDAQKMLDEAPWITRFFTTISSHEMTRDPVFAFNPELSRVDSWTATRARVTSNEFCTGSELQVTYPDASKSIISCSLADCADHTVIRPVPGEDALYEVSVIDEWGTPRPFDPTTSDEVDEAIGDAQPGEPSLPPDYELKPPPARGGTSHLYDGAQNNGLLCSAAPLRGESGSSPLGLLAALAIGAMLWHRRRDPRG